MKTAVWEKIDRIMAENAKLKALLEEAVAELEVLASYLPDGPFPNAGLRATAKAHARLAERLKEVIK